MTCVPGNQPPVPCRSTTPTRAIPAPTRSRPTRPWRRAATATSLSCDRAPASCTRLSTRVPGPAAWRSGSGAIFDLHSNALRPDGWTSRRRRRPADPSRPRAPRRGRGRRDPPRAALHRRAHPARLRPSGHALRQQRHGARPAADGPARAPEGRLRPRPLHGAVARDPGRAEELRHVRGRQRLQLVHHRRARPALERRRPRAAQAVPGPRSRSCAWERSAAS